MTGPRIRFVGAKRGVVGASESAEPQSGDGTGIESKADSIPTSNADKIAASHDRD